MQKVVEFKVFTNKVFEDCPLQFQNTIYLLLDKFKKEGNKIKIGKTKPIENTIRKDAKELLGLGLVSHDKQTDFTVKIYEKSEIKYPNEGLNIEIDATNEKIKLTKIKTP